MNDFLARNAHRLSLASAALVFAAAAAWLGARDTDLQRASDSESAASGALASNPPPAPPPRSASDPRDAWRAGSVTDPAGRGRWVAQPRPVVQPNLLKGRRPVEPAREVPVLGTPGLSVEAEAGLVRLTWKIPAPPKGRVAARLSGVRVLRRAKGGAEETLATLPPGGTSYEDTSVASRGSYAYAVVLVAAEAAEGGRRESDRSNTIEAEVPADFSLRYNGGSDDGAILVVRKRLEGEWREETFNVVPGGAIGEKKFATGCTLVSIAREPFRFSVPVQRSEWKDGELVTRTERQERTMRRYRIEYTDDLGRTCRLWVEATLPEGAEEAR